MFFFVCSTVVSLVGTYMRAITTSYLWLWFVVPTFGLPALGLVPAYGLALLASYLSFQGLPRGKDYRTDGEKISHTVVNSVMLPFLVLVIGAITNYFM